MTAWAIHKAEGLRHDVTMWYGKIYSSSLPSAYELTPESALVTLPAMGSRRGPRERRWPLARMRPCEKRLPRHRENETSLTIPDMIEWILLRGIRHLPQAKGSKGSCRP